MAISPQHPMKIRHADRPELPETFVDSIHSVVWDGQTMRIEFCVTRYPDNPSSPGVEAARYPAARLVLTAPATTDLFNRLQQTMHVLAQAGIVSAPQQPKQ